MGADGFSLIELMFSAPLVAFNRRWPRVLHAVDMEQIAPAWKKGGSVTAVCGATRLKVLACGPQLVLWPPQVKSLHPDHERCRACHEATGRKRPRSIYKAAA